MDYQVLLNNGKTINLTNAQFDATGFTTTLNDQKVVFVNISGAIINKHLIQMILPSASVEPSEPVEPVQE